MTKKAFTLIELLVVITIISILAAMLFPAFTQAKNAAKGIVCISNMKQLSAATMLYQANNDDAWYPLARYEPLAGFADQIFWIGFDNNNAPLNSGYTGEVNKPAVNPPRPGLLDPYLKNEGVKQCPNRKGGSQMAIAANGFSPFHASAYYTTNPAAQGAEYGPGARSQQLVNGVFEFVGASGSEIEEPSNTLAAWEHDAFTPLCNFLQSPDWVNGPPNSQALKDHFNLLHFNGTNAFWCDGHAKRMEYGALRRPMFSVRKDFY